MPEDQTNDQEQQQEEQLFAINLVHLMSECEWTTEPMKESDAAGFLRALSDMNHNNVMFMTDAGVQVQIPKTVLENCVAEIFAQKAQGPVNEV